MTWRGPIAMVALLAIGATAGYAGSVRAAGQPTAEGVPSPLVAEGPAYPVDPPPEITPDPDIPPLATELTMTRGRVGFGPFRLTFPVPKGWRASPNSPNETKWYVEANPSYTYVLRVENVISQRQSVQRILESRIADLEDAEDNVDIIEQTPGFLHFTYLADGRFRHGLLRWVDLSKSGFAEVEIALTGRAVDVEGMKALMEQVRQGLKQG